MPTIFRPPLVVPRSTRRPTPVWLAPNLLLTTLVVVEAGQAPFVQLDWPVPQRGELANLTWLQNLLQGTLRVDPFAQLDWPVPMPAPAPHGVQGDQNMLLTILSAPPERMMKGMGVCLAGLILLLTYMTR